MAVKQRYCSVCWCPAVLPGPWQKTSKNKGHKPQFTEHSKGSPCEGLCSGNEGASKVSLALCEVPPKQQAMPPRAALANERLEVSSVDLERLLEGYPVVVATCHRTPKKALQQLWGGVGGACPPVHLHDSPLGLLGCTMVQGFGPAKRFWISPQGAGPQRLFSFWGLPFATGTSLFGRRTGGQAPRSWLAWLTSCQAREARAPQQ